MSPSSSSAPPSIMMVHVIPNHSRSCVCDDYTEKAVVVVNCGGDEVM